MAAHQVWSVLGLFDWLGIDFGLYWAASRALLAGDTSGFLSLQSLRHYVEPLRAYYTPVGPPLQVGPTPYLPILLAIAPLTVFDPSVGFVIWSLLNLALAMVVVFGMCRRFPDANWTRGALVLCFLPLVYTIWVGQPLVLLLFAFYRGYLALEDRRDLRAGAWLGVLLLKPHYAAVLLLVLVYRRRWRCLLGVALSAAALGAITLALVRPTGVPAYLEMLRYASGFRDVDPVVNPGEMPNWRGLLVNVLPSSITEGQGVFITLALSAATVATLIPIWRGPWQPRAASFPLRMLATMAVTLLVSFHGHIHGAVLLLVPALGVAAGGRGPRIVQRLLRIGLFLPVPFFTFSYMMDVVAFFFLLLMSATVAAVLIDEIHGRGHTAARLPEGLALPGGCGLRHAAAIGGA
jgi:hypothetical protein